MSTLQAKPAESHNNGFLPKDLIRFSLPYRNGTETEWIRTNGNVEYIIRAGRIIDSKTGEFRTMLPSGKCARAIMLWFCTQAKLNHSPEIELKPSMRSFLKDLGIPWSGINAHEVSNQLQALLNCSLQILEKQEAVAGEIRPISRNLLISRESNLWFVGGQLHDKHSSFIQLDTSLYEQLTDAVPVSLEAVRYLQATSKSPMVLDIYLWLCLRLYIHAQNSRVSWVQLSAQFGNRSDLHKFKQNFRNALEKVREVYPSARILEVGDDGRQKGFQGFLLYPSPDPRTNFQEQQVTAG